tara:strand:+ start:36 stop:185 length:150 start_codon:yes stop_codon:yes gene_type:complete
MLVGWVDKYPNEPAFLIPKILEEKVKVCIWLVDVDNHPNNFIKIDIEIH